MTILTILQARTTSSRLPGKALLPINGIPTSALAALRAAHSGPSTLVATSDDASDDTLASELKARDIKVFRGPLQDVLQRYVLAAKELLDDDVIIRLTADNVIPDGRFVSELVTAFQKSGLDYLGGPSPLNHLPYGLGGEIFRSGILRKAADRATSPYDHEHVTPWIRRNGRCGVFIPERLGSRDFGHLRCTIDDREDYERIVGLFSGVGDPVGVDWFDLMLRLAEMPAEPKFRIPYRFMEDQVHGSMTLGTVQLGMNYGIANRTGQPSQEVATKIIRTAIAHGVTTLDTARAYGDSEQVLRIALSGAWASRALVITKLDPLAGLAANAMEKDVRNAVKASVESSLQNLGVTKLPVLMLHRWAHRAAWNGAAWRQLMELRDAGRIGVLGASVYEPWEAKEALADRDIAYLQIPFNILDHRWRAAGFPASAMTRPDVVIHARSALLQGVLGSPADRWPCSDLFNAEHAAETLRRFAKQFGREDVVDLCFGYARAQEWITSVVVGCETEGQLATNLRYFCNPVLTHEQCAEVEEAFRTIPERLLNPSKWEVLSGHR